MAYYCDLCGNKIEQGASPYTRTNKTTGQTIHLCASCFEQDTGVTPDTYFSRKYGCYIFIASVLATIYVLFKFGLVAGGVCALVSYFIYKCISNL